MDPMTSQKTNPKSLDSQLANLINHGSLNSTLTADERRQLSSLLQEPVVKKYFTALLNTNLLNVATTPITGLVDNPEFHRIQAAYLKGIMAVCIEVLNHR